MKDRSPKSPQTISADSPSAISSAESAAGATHSDSPASQTTPTSGPAPARVSRSRAPARGAGSATLDIFGQHGSHSSASADLQRSLESRLRALTASSGSTLFSLTWKDAVTPSGRRICALRASARRTQDSASTSWPTPVVNDAKGSDYAYSQGDHDRVVLKLGGAAKLVNSGGQPSELVGDSSSSRGGRHTGAVSNAQASGEGARLEHRRERDELVDAGPDGRPLRLSYWFDGTIYTVVDGVHWCRGALADAGGHERGSWRRCSEVEGTPEHERAKEQSAGCSDVGRVADAVSAGRAEGRSESRHGSTASGGLDHWRDVEWVDCSDGKRRPIKPGIQPLAHGVPNRVGTLSGSGNAIVPQCAAIFIIAAEQAREESER